MLKRMQLKYAEQPVRFLLVPCNQFGAQEPKSNADVKTFAEQYVTLGSDSSVMMLAKSNLNGLPCDANGADTCTPGSAKCCPMNDPIYEYLLAATPPGKITWNFDKIIVDSSGKPLPSEKILHGGDLDDVIDASIASARESVLAEEPARLWSGIGIFVLLSAVLAAAAINLKTRVRKSRRQQPHESVQTPYIFLN